ncbi:hypothetical protein CHS0354_000580 [Potamilus streckersoni]|uniref:Threonylcarbamoyl-AMP synthase n=1 Tax=Potamilus streckersoni TaxID=2493646 RepID=A0AAE0T6V7_9BIVA|nr:hypothetical protein CHS0354_000580 [Potamilus streckersoni]
MTPYKISPSILTADFANLGRDIFLVETYGASYIHVDVMDGVFVPNITIGPLVVSALKKMTSLAIDVHLMIEKPERYINDFISAGANVLTLHVEACTHLHRAIEKIKSLNCKAGVALNPSTPASTIEEILPFIDLILVMSVNPGFGGQSFIKQSLRKISQIKEMITQQGLSECELEVDGGINANNIKSIFEAGANVFVAGSAIFNQSYSIEESMKKLKQALETPQNTFIELHMGIHNEKMDEAIGLLYQFGFEYFREEYDLLIAYLPLVQFTSEIQHSIEHEILILFQAKIISCELIEPQNWNKKWEDSLEPFTVGRFEIVPHVSINNQISNKEHSNLIPLYITPEMSFGTATHETTQLMLEQLDKYLCPNDTVLDIGTGTGILAIACRKLNNHNLIYGIDNDEWSVKNAISNVERNQCQNIHIVQGDALCDVPPLLRSNTFNFILANLNPLLLIAEKSSSNKFVSILDKQAIIRLGEGVSITNMIAKSSMDRLIACLTAFKKLIITHNAKKIVAIGTSALRDASNRNDVINHVFHSTGIRITIIGGQLESELSFKGALFGLFEQNSQENICVIDIGGGSTELVQGTINEISKKISLNIGAVRIYEMFFKNAKHKQLAIHNATTAINNVLNATTFLISPHTYTIGVAGTITTLAQLHLEQNEFIPEKINNTTLSKSQVEKLTHILSTKTITEIIDLGVPPERADILFAGSLILKNIMAFYDIQSIAASIYGLQASHYIKQGKIVAFPTETVYGLGANVYNETAISTIYHVKSRPIDNPLIIHLWSLNQLNEVASTLTTQAQILIKHFFPGPLTIIVRKHPRIPNTASRGLNTIGVRMPKHKTAHKFLQLTGVPIAAPSANISGSPSATRYQDVLNDFKGKIPFILKGNQSEYGIESTVVDCSDINTPPTILRHGSVSEEELKAICSDIISTKINSKNKTVRSPGQKYKHYSPLAKVILLPRPPASLQTNEAFIGVSYFTSKTLPTIMICKNVTEYAHNVFAFFRICDSLNIITIYCQIVEPVGIGRALMERLVKAAG